VNACRNCRPCATIHELIELRDPATILAASGYGK
jgi:hypothetical protein